MAPTTMRAGYSESSNTRLRYYGRAAAWTGTPLTSSPSTSPEPPGRQVLTTLRASPYDAESGLQRLRGWMGEEEPPDEARPQVEPVSETERLRLAGIKLDAVERLAQKRISNARLALGAVVLVSVLAGLGLLFRLSYVPARIAMPVLVAVGAIDGAMTLAVVALYRTTMRGLYDDLRLAFGEQAGRREKPDKAVHETTRPAARHGGGRPLVVRSGGGTRPQSRAAVPAVTAWSRSPSPAARARIRSVRA